MQVVKRSGKTEDVSFDKITARIKKLCYGFDPKYIDYIEICKKVIQGALIDNSFKKIFQGAVTFIIPVRK